MAHKTLISGTAYDVKGGRDLIGGTSYSKKNGKVPIDGTAYAIPFSKGIPLNTITPGAILMLNESGSPVQFYIAKHDYESGLNGAGRTLLVRKDCLSPGIFSYNSNNAYASSELDNFLNNNNYLGAFASDIQDAIGTTKFCYTPGNGNSTVTTLQRAVFQLSITELGRAAAYANVEGSALPIASTLQIAYRNYDKATQWTRTPNKAGTEYICYLMTDGLMATDYYGATYCYRPAFTLPGTLALAQNADGTYSIAE